MVPRRRAGPTAASVRSDDRPIGVFDSGFGGLTVLRALADQAPAEHLVYVGDTGRYPYGTRPQAEVRFFARQIADYLVREHDAKLVVVACNTATAAAFEDLCRASPVPVVGVIEPGMRAAVKVTTTGRVGVIGTVGTIGSGAYQEVAAELGTIELHCAACPGFVEFVARGETRSDQVAVLAERLLAPLREAAIDTLLLGCTHYPFLARTIADVMGRDVVLVSSADETAFEVREVLAHNELVRQAAGPGDLRCHSTGDVGWFRRMGGQLFGEELADVSTLTWLEVSS